MDLMKTELESIAKPVMPIGESQIADALATLNKYREGKATLDSRIVENERWYRDRYWTTMESFKQQKGKGKAVEPVSAWLFNSVANKHADAMDNFPEINYQPREQGDVQTAKMLSAVVPAICQYDDFEDTYSKVQDYKLKSGTGVYGVFWDSTKQNGIGDITIRKQDVLNLAWQPGVADIQDSPNFFAIANENNEKLLAQWPQLDGHLGGSEIIADQYAYDEGIDTTDQSTVVDWYYKRNIGGKTVLHYCKFCNGVVLYATENDTEPKVDPMTGAVISEAPAVAGLYDHGQYPFVFDPLFCVERSPCGLSYVDIAKWTQWFIDTADKGILQNLLANTRPRHFFRKDGGVNLEQYADVNNDYVEVEGSLDEKNIRPIDGKSLDAIYVNVLQSKIEELKEVTGNRDISTGGTTSGVTAASAIAAMQEAGSKLSRDSNKASYRAVKKVGELICALVKQFYSLPRCFRIMGDNGAEQYIMFSNQGMMPREVGDEIIGSAQWSPVFDVEVHACKQSPYSRMAQNELALQFFQMGFFNPQMAPQALACLDMMDFDRKDIIQSKISEGYAIYQQQMMMAQAMAQSAPEGDVEPQKDEGESPVTKKARQRVAESTSPV